MEGELEAPQELETPAIETEAEEQPVDLEALANEENAPQEAEEQTTEPVEEEDELEWNGKKFKGPKGSKDGFLMHADYTKKTQGVSQRVKELDAREERITQQAKASDEEIQHRAAMHTIDSELKRFAEYDWATYQAHRQQDPLSADEAWNYKAHLLAQKQEVGAKLTEAENTRTASAQQDFAKRMQDTETYARSKGWTTETDKQVIDFALSKGADPNTLRGIMNPLVYELLYLARIGDQRLQKPAPKPTAQPEPLTTVASKANPPARKSVGEMSMDEYVAHRQKQMSRR